MLCLFFIVNSNYNKVIYMAHIYTYEEIKREFEDKNYILITDHKLKSSEKYEYICKKHQDKGSQFIDWGHFHCGNRGCYYCGREKTLAARTKDLSEYNGKELAESKGFEYIDTIRRDSKIFVQFICPHHREYGVQEMWYFNMKRDITGCQHCIGRNDSEEFVLKEMNNVNQNMILLEPYNGRTKRVKALCTIHNTVAYTTPNNIIHGKGCYYCGLEKLSDAQKVSKDIYDKRLREKQPNISLLSEYDCMSAPVVVRCNICGYEWTNRADYILHTGCTKCGCNTTEFKVGKILSNNGFEYITQFSFEDCKDKRSLPFDFYIPSLNVLIEYDGEGHYQPVNFGGISDDEALRHMLYTQQHDKIKTEYCKNNNIPLIRIPYWKKNNLEEYLMTELKQYV